MDNIIGLIAKILLIIGGLNWGLIGAANFDLVGKIFGVGTIADIVYILVGISALCMIYESVK